jgi:hypothetical protein
MAEREIQNIRAGSRTQITEGAARPPLPHGSVLGGDGAGMTNGQCTTSDRPDLILADNGRACFEAVEGQTTGLLALHNFTPPKAYSARFSASPIVPVSCSAVRNDVMNLDEALRASCDLVHTDAFWTSDNK